MLHWFRSSEARNAVRAMSLRYRLSGYDADEDTVLAEAAYAVWRRMQSPKPLAVRQPGAYGTAVIRSVLVRVIRDRSRTAAELPSWLSNQAEPPTDDHAGDPNTRSRLARAAGPEWLQLATIAFVDLTVGDLVVDNGTPQPRSGATPAQAMAWAALWNAGLSDLFPDHDTTACRKARSRKVTALLEHLADAA